MFYEHPSSSTSTMKVIKKIYPHIHSNYKSLKHFGRCKSLTTLEPKPTTQATKSCCTVAFDYSKIESGTIESSLEVLNQRFKWIDEYFIQLLDLKNPKYRVEPFKQGKDIYRQTKASADGDLANLDPMTTKADIATSQFKDVLRLGLAFALT